MTTTALWKPKPIPSASAAPPPARPAPSAPARRRSRRLALDQPSQFRHLILPIVVPPASAYRDPWPWPGPRSDSPEESPDINVQGGCGLGLGEKSRHSAVVWLRRVVVGSCVLHFHIVVPKRANFPVQILDWAA